MKQWFSISTLSILLLCGCSSVQQGTAIPVPATTPFDSDPFARTAYLDAFREGYRAVVNTNRVGSPEILSGPYPFAQQLGWRAGASQAQYELNSNRQPAVPH